MANGGQANITIVDGGQATIIVAGSSTQLVLGCSSSGTANQIVATRSPSTLSTSFGVGPLVEAAGLACVAGGTVLAIKVPSNTAGAILAPAGGVAITQATNASPIVVTTASTSSLVSGQVLTIASVGGNTAANGTWQINVLTGTTFSLLGSTGNAPYTSGGTYSPTGATYSTTGSSNAAVWGTGAANDTYYVRVNFTVGGTVGTAGIVFQVSLDAGRNFGPSIALGTALTYVIPSTGITLNLNTGQTVAAGDFVTFSSTEPTWNTAGIQAALNAFQASPYAISGVGSIHVVGSQAGAASGAACGTIEGYLDALATGYIYNRAYMSARDASPAAKWGGTGEVEATWMTSIQNDYSAVTARRIGVGAGYWNMPTVFPNPSAWGAPAYRRPVTYAAAARQVTVPPQRHLGRVKDGSLGQIVINSALDPLDGFVYHDERVNPGLDYIIVGAGSSRFMSTMTRTGIPGVFITNPLSMAPLGSDFYLIPLGNVMDVFSTIVHQTAQQTIDSDVRLNPNGTIYENDARAIETAISSAVNQVMFAQNMISQPVGAGPSALGSAIVVDRTVNVKTTSTVVIVGTILARGYVLTETITLSYLNPNAAV